MNKEIYILGVGHNTPVYIDLVESCGYTIKGLYHYNEELTGKLDHGYPIIGSYNDLFSHETLCGMNFALSQGNNEIRADLFKKIRDKGGKIPTLIHPTVQISRFAKIGIGCVVHINTVIHPDVVIGDNTVLSYNVSISHNTYIGCNCYFAFGALIGAYVHIADNAFVGIGALIVSGKVHEIAKNAYIGAGAVVTHNVEEYTVVAGMPAKVLRTLEH